MVAKTSQVMRAAQVITALGRDALQLRQFNGTDHVDDLFEYEVEAQCADTDAKLDSLLGTHATVAITTKDHGDRYFDGIVTAGRWVGETDDRAVFRLTLRPWFALLEQRRNQRIFHNKSVVGILEELFNAYAGLGDPAVEMRLTKSYPDLEYTVQYRESDLAFARRMMERFGLSFHFKHAMGSHTMVITDAVDRFDDAPGKNRPFLDVTASHDADEEHFWQWQKARHMTTGAVMLKDFNFKSPTAKMDVERTGDATYSEGAIEAFDYPGDYTSEADGKDLIATRVAQERGKDHRHTAEGDCVSLGAGMKITLTGQAAGQVVDDSYLCLSATHFFADQSYASGDAETGLIFKAHYSFVPVDEPYAAARKTPLALVHGPQTAVVTGEGEIDCDDFGRIIVTFHWDLAGANSMRCRVSQNWAGSGFGGMIVPRVGMEVVVEFLEGDPDKPLVTGCVYNGKNDVPYDLPDHKTRSTFKTKTHQGKGFNELRFEDKTGAEEIYVHASKDRNAKVENNQSERVNVNKVESVGHDKASEVGNNMLQVVDGNMDIRVGPANKNTVTPAGASKAPEGLPDLPETFGKAGSNPGEGALNLSVDTNKTQTIGENHAENVRRNKTSVVGDDYELRAGKTINITAGDKIAITVGKSRIEMTSSGDIQVNGTKIGLNASALVEVLGKMVKIN